ncbi:unnamed protein product [Rodentolepis nana]|uniref:BTB domain-containing protein n=1 Tax=Rodentolepis nana TaxID=102285 RepID=A0A0R3TN85_RODNA|nr:unnamed protein product [Rodentolepis nana]
MMGSVRNNEDNSLYFSAVQDKMYDYYKEGKLVDVTWRVGSKEEEVNAHSSVCALSYRLKELLLAHRGDGSKRIIRIPSSLTNSADELKSLLFLAYTGMLEENRSIAEYIELCERFDMPIGYAVCSGALRVLFMRTLLQPSVNVEEQKTLQRIFVDVFEKTTSMEVRQTMLDMFRMHPLIFNKLRGSKVSCEKHPPNEWKVCAITGHVSRSWDNKQVLAGLDITYENLITGLKEEVLWGYENEELYTKKTIQVPDDDIITGVIINSGWLIDKLVFTTLRGMHLDALGGSDGGNVTVIEPSNFWGNNEDGSPLVAFHGISYINIKSRGQTFINRVKFRFSCVDREVVLRLNENEKEFANEFVI